MNVLLISTSSYAGMGPYASEIINSLESSEENKFYSFLLEDERMYFSKNLKEEALCNSTIIKRENSKLNKLLDLLTTPRAISRKILTLCVEKKIDVVHLLTVDTICLKIIPLLYMKYNLVYTIHDLIPHEMAKAFYKNWRTNVIIRRADKMMHASCNLVTNSLIQYNMLKEKFSDKNIYFHHFPSLISDSVKTGTTVPPELCTTSLPYVLFFGRIEKYKGIDILYQAYIEEPKLFNNFQLVIAGSGDIYFSRNIEREKNVIFINRYIDDGEISFLYQRAQCVVYPYISASQSGVLSLASFFNTPILASNVPFFKVVEEKGIGVLFESGSSIDLLSKLQKLLVLNKSTMRERQAEYYLKHYDSSSLSNTLRTIYKSLLTNH